MSAIRSHVNGTMDIIEAPPRYEDAVASDPSLTREDFDEITKRTKALGSDGIAEVGVKVKFNDILVNRKTPVDTTTFGVSSMMQPTPTV